MHLVRSSIVHTFQNRGGTRKKIARAQEWEGGKYGMGSKALAFLNLSFMVSGRSGWFLANSVW